MKIPSHIHFSLEKRKKDDSFRSLKLPNKIDFSSNDFFGLSTNNVLLTIVKDAISQLSQTGAKGSRLLTGNMVLHEELEQYLSTIFKADSTLLFNSGYDANVALLSCLPQKSDTILLDENVHASIKDGARLSFSKKISFKHNNSEDLDKKLSLAEGNKYVVVESLYSMEGDFCAIETIIKICKKHNAFLIVDEAHSTAIYGKNASGWISEKGLEKEVFARIFTFGKAVGFSGACIVGPKDLKDYLINFARPFIYTTAMSLVNVSVIKEHFKYIIANDSLKTDLFDTISYFKSCIKTNSYSAIQPIYIPENGKVKEIAQLVQQQGFDVRPILSPTVPKGKELIRICIHSFNTKEQIDKLSSILLSYKVIN